MSIRSDTNPYDFLKSNIAYVDKKSKTSATDECGEDSYGSEKSYDDLISHDDFMDIITFMTTVTLWKYLSALANLILYCVLTYSMSFDRQLDSNAYIFVVKTVCNCIIIVDIVFAFLHYSWREIRNRRVNTPRNILIQIVDVISLCSVLISFIPKLRIMKNARYVQVACISIRHYRILMYFREVTSTAGKNTKTYLLLKHGLIYAFIIHSFACIWMIEGYRSIKSEENKILTWINKDTVLENVNVTEQTSFNLYILSVLYVVGGVTSVALGGGSALKNDAEKAILICLMLISFFYLNGVCLGTFTSVQVEKYRRQTQFINRYKMIVANLGAHKISKTLKHKMLRYYIQFWRQRDAINHSKLFNSLPLTIRKQVLLDKYWFALDQIHIFKNIHDSFKRALSCHMVTRVCIPGEVIYNSENARDRMTYIAKGSVHLLSTVDGESPLITLGTGSTLGKFNLLYSLTNPTKVIAATYCTIYVLDKIDVWKEISKYKQLDQAMIVHTNVRKIMQHARALNEAKHDMAHSTDTPLQRTKRLLRTENEVEVIDYKKKRDSMESKEKISNIYVLSKRSNILSDGIFIHTKWPWILQNESALLEAWEIIVVLTILICCIGYPYEVAFRRRLSVTYSIYRVFGDCVYIIDIVFKLFTAVESEQGLLTTVVEISLKQLSKMTFIFDILTVIPFYQLAYFSGISHDERILSILVVTKLLKFYRVIGYLQKLEYNFRLNIAYVRLLKYVLFLLYSGYILGSLYFMVLCFRDDCDKDMEKVTKSKNPFSYSIMTAMLIISGTGGIVNFHTIEEVAIILCISIVGTLTVVYLVADYSATLTLAEREITIYMEMINVMRKFMITNRMVKHIQIRMNQYLKAKWLDCKGMNYKDLYTDAPKQLFEEFQVKKYTNILHANPLFHHLHYKIIRRLAVSCESIALPPNEYVTYAGEVSREMYIIENGYCELISGSSEKVEKILGPMSSFCVIDTLLELAAVFNIRTITHTRLLKLRFVSIKEAMSAVPEIAQQLTELSIETRESFAARRLFTLSSTVVHHVNVEEKDESWFVFPSSIVDTHCIDFHNGWSKFTVFKYIMLRRTILPYGNLIIIWEIVRGIFAFLAAMIYPVIHIYQYYIPNFNYFMLILDFAGMVDIYIRLHVCYYNKLGILVKHPRMTAKNYLSSSFIIDFLGIFPTDYAIYAVERKSTTSFNRLQTFVRFNRVIQIYRLPDAFSFFTKDALKRQGVYISALKYLLLTCVLMNFWASIVVNMSVIVDDDKFSLKLIRPENMSWILLYGASFSMDTYEPINMYFQGFYWITTTTLQLSFGSVNAGKDKEVIFIICAIVSGYLWYTYVTVIILNSKATINAHLTLYQNHMKRLIRFMKDEKISKELQSKAINHFEYIWQRTHGMDASNILNQVHLALRKDCALYLYEETLKHTPIFTDMLPSFYRILGTKVNENYYLKNYPIIQLNDIVKYVYIIHKGEVLVIGPDGSYFDTLTRGCVFGNLDDIKYTRSMVTIVSNSNVDLLTIQSEKLYDIIKDYPVVKNRIMKHMLLENLSYINTKDMKIAEVEADSLGMVTKKISRVLASNLMQYLFVGLSLLSYILITYQFAFRNSGIVLLTITYVLDVAHVGKTYVEFKTRHQRRRENGRDKRSKRRFFTFNNFLDIYSLLPLEIFCLLTVTNRMFFFALLRMNRCFRLWHIYRFFNISYNFLNINVLGIKIASIFITIATIVHTESCVWYIIGVATKNAGWMYNIENESTCVNEYLCSFYFAISMTSFCGYMNIRPRTTLEINFAVFNTILNKFIAAVIIGDMSSITKSYASTLTNYDYSRRKMELFLKHSYISMPLFKEVMYYTSQLWHKRQGYQIPIFMTQAPPYLSASIKWAAFGHHIRENWVFKDCHTDFIRILIRKLQRNIYFTGDTICQQGDVNGTMYFIHTGKVNAYYITDTEEIHVDSLDENDCFGMIQGLFPNTPQTHTFKAIMVTSVISLEMQSWVHMLQFYPGSKFLIYDRLSKLDLYAKGRA